MREGAGALALAARREVVTGRDREVAQARERWRGAAVLELAAVVVGGAVAAVGPSVFDAPVRAERGREGDGVGVQARDPAAGEHEDGLGLNLAVGELPAAVHARDLRDVRKREFAGGDCAGLDRAGFDPAAARGDNVPLRGNPRLRVESGARLAEGGLVAFHHEEVVRAAFVHKVPCGVDLRGVRIQIQVRLMAGNSGKIGGRSAGREITQALRHSGRQ